MAVHTPLGFETLAAPVFCQNAGESICMYVEPREQFAMSESESVRVFGLPLSAKMYTIGDPAGPGAPIASPFGMMTCAMISLYSISSNPRTFSNPGAISALFMISR